MIADASTLARELGASRTRLQRIITPLADGQLLGPKLPNVNPPLWELGHLAWFQEFWCLRHRDDGSPRDSILRSADALYDSAKVAHSTRWSLPLPTIADTHSYLADVLGLVQRRLETEPENTRLGYFADLAAFHEDMHAEAFHYTRQTLGYSDPLGSGDAVDSPISKSTDAELEGGAFLLGASQGTGFVFDNEKWAHEVRVEPFSLARTAVTNAEYAAFVDAGGYARREFWSEAGSAWLAASGLKAPRYWQKAGDGWRVRSFDRVIPLPRSLPVMHVNWHEADAYCRFADRRLPTETEWEYAASRGAGAGPKPRFPWGDAPPAPEHANLEGGAPASVEAHAAGDSADGCRQLIGNVWEWTASTFGPYPGYVVDPYKEYSQPWFGNHMVLRGGSFATARRLVRSTWRNFYTPDRGDIFAGFRTCAARGLI